MDPAKRTSSERIVRSSSSVGMPSGTQVVENRTEPSVCPGAWATSMLSPASSSRSRSLNSTICSGSVHVARRQNCCYSAITSCGLIEESGSASR